VTEPGAEPAVGVAASLTYVVGPADTAIALGSGDLEVLATPRVVAWLEAATCAAVRDSLGDGETTVGVRIEVDHVAASQVGAHVTAAATLAEVDGRRLAFHVRAYDDHEVELGAGTIVRVVVDRRRFLGRLGVSG
jgi:fluoroacetyl-CoA thioesterase